MEDMTRRLLRILMLAMMCLPFCACEKEESDLIEVLAEPLDGGKVLVDGYNGTWVNGDVLCINGDNVSVVRDGSRAYISYASAQSVNRAVYPASLVSGSLNGDNVTLTLPSVYHYRSDGNGHQLIELPMAARSTDRNPLEFRHLTGAICVKITNGTSTVRRLYSVTIGSNAYKLSGSRTINLNGLNTNMVESASANEVKMYFDTGYVLPIGETVKVLIPVLPVGNSNKFSIEVKSYIDGINASYKYENEQTTGGNLDRNQLGYAPVTLVNNTAKSLFENAGADSLVIFTPLDFKLMTLAVNNEWEYGSQRYSNKNYKIVDNLDMSGITITSLHDFNGILSGNNHTISNLTITSYYSSSHGYFCGLCGYACSGTVKDIRLDNLTLSPGSDIENNDLYMGGIFAQPAAAVTVSNCHVNIGTVNLSNSSSGTLCLGGIIGKTIYNTTINNCSVTTNENLSLSTDALVYFGGIIGNCSGTSKSTTFNNTSWANTDRTIYLSSSRNIYFGGMVGYKNSGTFTANSGCQVSGTAYLGVARSKYYYYGAMIGYFGNPRTFSSDAVKNLTVNIKDTAGDDYSAVDPLPDYGTTSVQRP